MEGRAIFVCIIPLPLRHFFYRSLDTTLHNVCLITVVIVGGGGVGGGCDGRSGGVLTTTYCLILSSSLLMHFRFSFRDFQLHLFISSFHFLHSLSLSVSLSLSLISIFWPIGTFIVLLDCFIASLGISHVLLLRIDLHFYPLL